MSADEHARSTPFRRGELIAAALLLLLAFFLRFPDLSGAPPGLFRDELEKGYTALELWTTGRHGILGSDGVEITGPMPIFIETYAGHDRTSALYQYLTAPIVGVFGLAATTTRMTAALAGLATVLLGWLFARRLFGKGAGLVALAALAAHPTGVLFSRWAQQGILTLPLTIAGLWLLFEIAGATPSRRRAFAVIAGLLLGLAAYVYEPARLIVPLLFALFLATRGRAEVRELWKPYAWAVVAFSLLWVPLFLYTIGPGSGRLGRISAVGEEGSFLRIPLQYLDHFSPAFWFWRGDSNIRHSLPVNGFAGAGMTVLALAGIVVVIRRLRNRDWELLRPGLFMVGWLLIAPLAAALTRDTPHALRAGLMIPPVAFLAAYAWTARLDCGHRFLARMAVALLFSVDFVRVFVGMNKLPHEAGGPWEAGVQESMAVALARPGKVFLSASVPYASYVALFAEKTPPEEYHELGLGALRTELVAPGQTPEFSPGDTFIAPPTTGLPMEYFDQTVVIFAAEEHGVNVILPPRRE